MARARVTRGDFARGTLAAAFLLLGGCGASPAAAPPASSAVVSPTAASDAGEAFTFPDAIASPLGLRAVPDALAPFLAPCDGGDAALSRLAERFARRQSEGAAALDASEINFALRAEGSPYVWPRAWTLEGGDLTSATAVERMQAWLRGWSDGGARRCGVALAETRGRQVLAAVAVDALADLDPLPVRARASSWIEVSARLLVPAADAKFVLLGPKGPPRSLPTSFDGERARARFRADRAGPFLLQLLASVAGGPRPVLEATVYADVEPPRSYFRAPAPGEPSVPLPRDADGGEALLSMLNQARATEHSPPLRRDPRLDAVALQHAEAMRQQRRVAHDAGDGDHLTRLAAAGIDVIAAGENVAHALDVTFAHRALWASPSHRENLLQPRFDAVGLGVVPDADGSVWVCEVFADVPEAARSPH